MTEEKLWWDYMNGEVECGRLTLEYVENAARINGYLK